MTHHSASLTRGFTLMELSIVLLVLALLAAAAARYFNAQSESSSVAATNATLSYVETALYNYLSQNNSLPCPADLTQAENTAAFGTPTDVLGDGLCTGYNYINSTTDPDGPGGSDPGAPDALYDNTTLNQVVGGAIPTKALRIADKYAYDAWGNKIFYVVDKRITPINSFSPTAYNISNSTIGAIVIKSIPNGSSVASTGTLANALTYKAAYALVSVGKNGHGGYARNISATITTRTSAASSNTDELNNCHCNGSAAATAFNRIFVQKSKTIDSTSFTDNFDDIVHFKTLNDIANTPNLQ